MIFLNVDFNVFIVLLVVVVFFDVEEVKIKKKVRRKKIIKKDKEVEEGLVIYDEVSDVDEFLIVEVIDVDSEGEEIDLSKYESEDISYIYGWFFLVCCFGFV